MPRESRDETREGEGRKQRRPLGASRHRLKADVPKGMVGRWFNDSPGRIQAALDAGYHFIDGEGSRAANRKTGRKERVGVNPDGSVLHGYLMAIPEQFYREDQVAKQAEIDQFDEALRRGKPTGVDPADTHNFYTPSEGTTLRHGS